MTNESTFTTASPSATLADKIARGELVAGGIIAEFANGHDATMFVRVKGGAERYTITAGINLVFAVRPWITPAEAPPIGAGDRVRSYDFEDKRDCYVEGIVEGLTELDGSPRYKIRVERAVWRGKEEARAVVQHVYPPVNGTPRSMGGECNGVERVS